MRLSEEIVFLGVRNQKSLCKSIWILSKHCSGFPGLYLLYVHILGLQRNPHLLHLYKTQGTLPDRNRVEELNVSQFSVLNNKTPRRTLGERERKVGKTDTGDSGCWLC